MGKKARKLTETLVFKCGIILLTAALLIILPAVTNLYGTALQHNNRISTTYTTDDYLAIIQSGVNVSFEIYCVLVLALAAANLSFLLVEELKPWFLGSYGRFGAQVLVGVVLGALSVIMSGVILPILANDAGLAIKKDGLAFMALLQTLATAVMLFSSLYLATPTNRLSMKYIHLGK